MSNKVMRNTTMKPPYKFVDLFCGIGGFRIALEKCGMKCVFSSDIDKNVQEQYEKNFHEKPFGDITKILEKNIPEHDVLCAGFPCQPFSISGNHQGTRDVRGQLFYEIVRIAKFHKPSVLLLENVKNIMSINNGQTIKNFKKQLLSIGYRVHTEVLNASDFGIPQSRERVYFVGLKTTGKNPKMSFTKPKPTFKKIFLEDIMEKKVNKKLYVNRPDVLITKNQRQMVNKLKPIRIGVVNKGGQGERIYSIKGHAITLSAYGGGVGAKTGLYQTNSGQIRRLSITETKRLMGFDDNHVVSDGTKGYQQLGNAVIPKMIQHVWNAIEITT